MIRLHSLGQCVIHVGRSRIAPDAEVLFATALYLVVEHGRPVNRSELVELLWPAAEEARAQHSLRQALYKLKSLGFRFATEHAAIMLPSRDVETDYAPFLGEHRAAVLEELSERVSGSCLPGYAPRISQPYREWLDRHRDVVHSALRRALIAGIVAKRARADWSAVDALARKCLSLDPLNEEATLAVAEAAAVHGSKAYALTVIDRYLKEIGPEAREIRLPATALRRRIADVGRDAPIPLGQGPFVGRAPEMAALNQALDLAIVGQGSAFLLWGEAGIGKSRLTTEFSKGASLRHVQVVRVGCQSHDERRSLSAFVDLVPKLLELRGAIGCSPDSMKYLKRLTEHDPSVTTPSPDARESELLFSNIRRALFDLIDAIAAEVTVVLAVEDVHWLDLVSWEILRDVVPWLATRHVLLILTSRDSHIETPQRGRAISALRRVHIGPLPDAAGRELLDAMLARRVVDPAFRDWCLHTSAGNPYFMSELAAHTAAEGDTYRVPVSLTALIAERLTRLQPISRRVLQACAILGKNSTLERIETVLAQARVDLLDSLDDLERQGLIESDGPRLVTKHELLAQAAVAELSKSARQLLHRHAAAVLQADGERTQASVLLWECAEHWNAAGETERAVELLRSCAKHSLEMGVPGDAARTLERAVGMWAGEQDSVPLLRELALALRFAGQWEKVLPLAERVTEFGGNMNPHEKHTSDELVLIEAKWRNGFQLAELFEEVSECAKEESASLAHRMRAATLAMILADNLCCSTRATDIYNAIQPCLRATEVDQSALQHLELVYHCSFGDHDRAVQAAEALVNYQRMHGNPASLTRSLRHSSVARYCAGYTNSALAVAEESFHLANKHELHDDAIAAAHRLIEIHLHLDDLQSATHWDDEVQSRLALSHDKLMMANSASSGSELYIRRGQYAAAEAAINMGAKTLKHACLRNRIVSLAMRVALRLFRDNAVLAEEVAELEQLQASTRGYNDQDWNVYVLCRSLQVQGMHARANEVLADYVHKYRRERSGLLPCLKFLWDAQCRQGVASTSAGP